MQYNRILYNAMNKFVGVLDMVHGLNKLSQLLRKKNMATCWRGCLALVAMGKG